ncbi:MAG: sensor histidine kinase [Lachnospiraceae bacterium]
MIKRIQNSSIRTRMVLVFSMTTLLILIINIYMYINVNGMVNQLDEVYQSNISLNQLADTLTGIQASMTEYLNTRSSDAIEEYYRQTQNYTELVSKLNDQTMNNDLKMMEKKVRRMSENYLELTDQTIDAKRGGNVEKYKVRYEGASELYGYIRMYIYSLNNEQFRNNADSYQVLSVSLHYIELVNCMVLVLVAVCNVVLTMILVSTMTKPLQKLAGTADQVAQGNLDVELLTVVSDDEIGVVSKAFNQMVVSIRQYIHRLTESMEKERAMKERELMMETHLKDAQIKYLQAQINPHFLFNTLNAGAQLAMMEGAERTYRYVQKVADFFRYNVKKDNDTVTLREEIALVDTYIYILNVRFAGDIHFHKKIDESLLGLHVPSMILQPIVENSVNYGIRNIDWQGEIVLSVYREDNVACVSVKDNGIGISQEKIDKIMSSELRAADLSQDSNGIGLDNVIGRLRLFLDEKDVISILSDGENQGTEVIIYIPMTEGEYEDV